jgi:hypothetical protein
MFESEVGLLRHTQRCKNSRLDFENAESEVCVLRFTDNLCEIVGAETERRTMMCRRGGSALFTLTRTKKLSGQHALHAVVDREGLRLTIPASFESGQW